MGDSDEEAEVLSLQEFRSDANHHQEGTVAIGMNQLQDVDQVRNQLVSNSAYS